MVVIARETSGGYTLHAAGAGAGAGRGGAGTVETGEPHPCSTPH